MAGITSIEVYIPMYRLSRDEIGRMWRTKGGVGEKAVAGYDEDAVTMAVAAAQGCLRHLGREVSAVYFASTTAPYREKQNAAIIASAIDLPRTCMTVDFSNSLRSGTTAMRLAVDAAKDNSAKDVMVITADCRLGAPGGRFEQLFGDGAAAVTIGSQDVIAEVEGAHSRFNDFTDEWRTVNDPFVRSGETRFVDEAGYLPTMGETIRDLMKQHSLKPEDFSKIVFPAVDGRLHKQLVKSLDFNDAQVQDPLINQIGNTGTPAPFVMLASAFASAKEGDRILFAGYGDGADAFILRMTENLKRSDIAAFASGNASATRLIDYGAYLSWRELIQFESSSLPDRAEPSLATRWRERRTVSSLHGVKCRRCGTPQIHPTGQAIRVCAACQEKDDFDPYKFSDKKGKLFTYAVDILQPTKNPPGVNGVVDFDGGGRLICELIDYDLDKVAIGMPVEMTFRKLSQGKGIINYFWKAKPVR